MSKSTINLANTMPRTPVDFFLRMRRKNLAKALAIYLHSHDTEMWVSPSGGKFVKVHRCQDCEVERGGHDVVT